MLQLLILVRYMLVICRNVLSLIIKGTYMYYVTQRGVMIKPELKFFYEVYFGP